jgi:hypothetical protein
VKIAIVTGSRRYQNRRVVYDALDREYATWDHKGTFVVVHGAADGADTLAQDWVDRMRSNGNRRVYAAAFPAHWDGMGKAAGHTRNAWMQYYNDQYPQTNEVALVFHEFPTLAVLLAQPRGGTVGMVKRLIDAGWNLPRSHSRIVYHNEEGPE